MRQREIAKVGFDSWVSSRLIESPETKKKQGDNTNAIYVGGHFKSTNGDDTEISVGEPLTSP